MSSDIFLFLAVILSIQVSSSEDISTNYFTGSFPCLPNSSNISTQEDAQSCDLFVYAAVQLALERVGEELREKDVELEFYSELSTKESEVVEVSKSSKNGESCMKVLFSYGVELCSAL